MSAGFDFYDAAYYSLTMCNIKNVSVLTFGLCLAACQGGAKGGSPETAAVVTQAVASAAVTPAPTASPSASPSPTPSPSASPSPSPSPSASLSPHTFSGAGVLASPYEISTAADVQHIADYPAAYFELTQDIDMTGVTLDPIPDFSGVIQGHFYELENLTITTLGNSPAAIVLNLTGIILDVQLDQLAISSETGYAAAFAFNVYGTVKDCRILAGDIVSPRGGHGVVGDGTGVGNPIYVNRIGGSIVTGDASDVTFNGFIVNNSI